jgi:uncharacterized protein YecE (DUF72 family)
MKTSKEAVLLGIGGWEHDVLSECLYGPGLESAAGRLARYAEIFDVAEVRATFWDDTLGPGDARVWADAVSGNKRFSFVVKLHSLLTHRREFKPSTTQGLRGLAQELARRGRLSGLLAQFPYAFTNTSAARYHLRRLAEVFAGFPLFAELRHDSWNQPGLSSFLQEHGLQAVSGDLPRVNRYVPFLARPAKGTAYFRFHGRNEKGWLLKGGDARYDYLYNSRELVELRRRVDAMDAHSDRVIVIFNNTTGGKAVANALQFRAAMHGGERINVPAPALASFPYLEAIARPSVSEESLFSGAAYREAM